jgi:hypothetical protein
MTRERWSNACVEPPLWDVLADPIVLSLMRADRLKRKDVLAAVAVAAERAPDPAGTFELSV